MSGTDLCIVINHAYISAVDRKISHYSGLQEKTQNSMIYWGCVNLLSE
jgi:hypothetical protein